MRTLKLFLVLISLPAFCFETERPFLRINEENSTSEVGYRSYISENGQTTIQLIGTEHYALSSFYKSIEDLIEGKVVLYELAGGSLEELKQSFERVKKLLPEYYEFVMQLIGQTDPLGRVYQNMSYEKAQELIHADYSDGIKFGFTNPLYYLNSLNDDELKNYFNSMFDKLFTRYGVEVKNEKERGEKLKLCLNLLLPNLEKQLNHHAREAVKRLNNEIDIKSGKCPEILKKQYGNDCEKILIARNQFIFDNLLNLWSRNQVPKQIAIVYGAGHLPFVEEFLLKNGYQALKGSDGWLVTARLEPTYNNSNEENINVNDEEVIKIFYNSDDSIKLYIIGSQNKHAYSDLDMCFVERVVLGTHKKELSHKENNIVELIYTPEDFSFVEKQLLKFNFKFSSQAPIVRRERSKINMISNVGSLQGIVDSLK